MKLKLPLVEVAASLELQTPLNGLSDETKILWALHCQGMLLAACCGDRVTVFHGNSRRGESEDGSAVVLSRLSAVHIHLPSQRITALCWLSNLAQSYQSDQQVDVLTAHLMIGTEKGEFLIYDATGERILQQKLHTAPVQAIETKPSSMGLEAEAVEDVSVVFHDVLCCIPLPELLVFIRLHEAGNGQSADPNLKLAHGKFGFGRHCSNRTSAVHLGVCNTSLKTQLKRADIDAEESTIRILSVGKSPAIGVFEATVHRTNGSTLAFIGKVARFVASGSPLSYGRKMLRGAVRSFWSGAKEDELIAAEQTTLRFSLRDNKRHMQDLIPSPDNCLAAATDNLGRILLLDTQQSIVLRIWKGYRDAQCAWITNYTHASTEAKICLVIYGWRRGALEVWPMRYGPRIFSIAIGHNCKLLRTTPPMGLGNVHGWETKCAVMDFDNEEFWDVGERVFARKNDVEAVWDMMLQH